MRARTASRAALLELRNERRVVEDGHRFLDEKRALLAHEVLARLETFARRQAEGREREAAAAGALAEAVAAEGLEALLLDPPVAARGGELRQRRRSYLGIVQVDATSLRPGPADQRPAPVADPPPSAEAQACGEAYGAVVDDALELATELGNLLRLMREFQRTQRRVRALEKVILPELRDDERRMEDALEELEQEDVIRVRLAGRRRAASGRGAR